MTRLSLLNLQRIGSSLRRLVVSCTCLFAGLWAGAAWALVDMNTASYANSFVDIEGIQEQRGDDLMSTEATLNRLLGVVSEGSPI